MRNTLLSLLSLFLALSEYETVLSKCILGRVSIYRETVEEATVKCEEYLATKCLKDQESCKA